MTDVDLVNKDYGDKLKDHLLEQYKLFVQTSLDVTSKRLEANKFHLTLNSIIFGIAGFLTTVNQQATIVVLSIVGIVISIVWRKSILAYKELNAAKFKVIHELEKHMPACLFKCEESHYLKKYHGLTAAEQWYPIIFVILYVSIIVLAGYTYFTSTNTLDLLRGWLLGAK